MNREEIYKKIEKASKEVHDLNISFECTSVQGKVHECPLITFEGTLKKILKEGNTSTGRDTENLVEIKNGILIQPPTEFDFFDLSEFENPLELFETYDTTLARIYQTVADEWDGVRLEYLQETLGEEKFDYEASILYIGEIVSKTDYDLDLFLTLLGDYFLQVPYKNTKLIVVAIDKEKQLNNMHIYKENGWKIKALSNNLGFAYLKI